jgi:peptide/nickel transport system substrate-binding protein
MVTVLLARAPRSLDPAVASGHEATEADWLVYTPLLTYTHAFGVGGTRLIPGLATDLPTVSGGGTTYRLTLRTGLVYSDGEPVKASDFVWALQRAIRLGWPGSRKFLLGRVVGATAFAARRAPTISGIQTDDQTGQIAIRLTAADGEFEDVLALPSLAPVPRSTPMRDEQASPPSGAGPYRIARVVRGRSFSLVRNASWAHQNIAGIPAGHVDVDAIVSPDPAANVRTVLRGGADVLDPGNPIPAQLLGRVAASGSYEAQPGDATYAIVLDTTYGPFSSELGRQALATGLDRRAIVRLSLRDVVPGCYLLPPPLPGHPSAPCPYRGRTRADVVAARALVKRSGWSGAAVTVARSPSALTGYLVSLLERIGFHASVGNGPHPSAGLVLLRSDLPDPASIYGQLAGRRGTPSDPFIARQLRLLAAVPAAQLSAVATLWMALDEYVARKAYVAVIGYPTVRTLFSSRINAGTVILQPVTGIDWSSLKLK